MTARVLLILLVLGAFGCGAGVLEKPPKVDPAEQWIQSGKKVDFAITETKAMIQRARGNAYLPDLYMRLAELYTDRARDAWLVVYERRKARGDESHSVEAPEARLLKNLAISTYNRVVKEFPNYPKDDEAVFLTGHEYRELGDFDKMKETYEKLIETYPKSGHRLEAYLTLGDHAFDASDLPTAQRYYDRILAEPLSPIHALARYKLAWVKVNQGDCREAVRLFELTLKEGKEKPSAKSEFSASLLRTQKNLNVAREALIDLAYCYPEIYPDKPPAPYFRELASAAVDYIAAMRRLASRYTIKEMRPQAAVALREVLDGLPGDEDGVELVRRLHDSVTKANVYDHPAEDVERIVSVLDTKLSDYRLTADMTKRLNEEFELYARDIATRAQVAAKDSSNTNLYSLVADAYHAYLLRFGKSATADEIRENYAESLLAAKRFYEAGRAYEEASESPKLPDKGKQARLNAIAAYQQSLDSPALARLHRLVAWSGIRELGRRVIAEAPADPAVLGIKLSIARSYYEKGDYITAAQLFYAVERQYPTTNEGVAAANLALDALRIADNLEELTTVGNWMVADTRLREDVRSQLRDIVSKAAQRQVEEVTVSDSEDREAQLLALAKSHKGSEVGEEAFYNTLLLARSNGELERFYELGDQFLTDYPSSPRRPNVLGALATVAADSGAFKNEAKYMAAAFAIEPQGKESAERLYTAASIHAVLGDPATVGEISKLSDRGSTKVDDLLVLLAHAGHMALLDQVLGGSPLNTPTATFFRGYQAYQHGDPASASAAFAMVAKKGASGDLTGRARYLLGEIAYSEFRNVGAKGDLLATVDANVKGLAAVDRAFKPVIEGGEPRWAMAGLARLADANVKFAGFLRGLELPANLSEGDKAQLKGALEAQAAAAEKRGNELHGVCAKQAKKAELFSEAAKSCLLGQPLPDTLTMYKEVRAQGSSDPPGAAAFQKALLKNSRDADALTKLAELHLAAGNVGVALLLLERAEQVGTRKGTVQNLLGLTYYQLNETQEAGDAFKAAVAAEPSDPHWHLNLAAHCAAFGQMDRAKSELQKSGSLLNEPRGPTDHPDVSLLGQPATAPAPKSGRPGR
jgi:tetratricopeptide (TPR) repeat protein